MQIASNQIFSGTASGYGAWIDVAHFTRWSLHLMQLETGGTINLWGSNETFKPADNVADVNAVVLSSPVTATAKNVVVSGDSLPMVHWIQIQKTAGGSPTQTLGNLFAQL